MDTSSSAHRAAAAASSSSLRSSNRWKYEVFLSFRGEDTRNTFTDHLFFALFKAGINTSIDYQLRKGENIQSELDQKIEGSKIAVIVFSKRYAESRWCLRELSKIMRCLKDQEGKRVCPIFYDVEPSQVRKQTDSFGEAFQKHEKYEDLNVVKQWREDLKASADLVGWNLKTTADGREGVFIEIIVRDIKGQLKSTDSTRSLCIDVVNHTQRTKFHNWPMKATVTASHEYYLWLGNLSNKKLNLKGGDMVGHSPDEDTNDDTQLDIRHIFFCYKTPEAWPWCINGPKSNRLPKFFTSALKARKNDITFKTSMTVIEGHEGTEFSDGDVLIFPQMIKYRGLKESDVDSFVDDVLVNHKPWASGVPKPLTGPYVFICARMSQDEWNRYHARTLIDKFKQEAKLRGLTDHVYVTACFHIGGHKYAGNLDIYSPGSNGSITDHWYPFATPGNVPELLDKHIAKGEIIQRHWRGQMGASSNEAKKLMTRSLRRK
ncbi:hypothetical protein ACFX2I_031499 [Malus domestica]